VNVEARINMGVLGALWHERCIIYRP